MDRRLPPEFCPRYSSSQPAVMVIKLLISRMCFIQSIDAHQLWIFSPLERWLELLETSVDTGVKWLLAHAFFLLVYVSITIVCFPKLEIRAVIFIDASKLQFRPTWTWDIPPLDFLRRWFDRSGNLPLDIFIDGSQGSLQSRRQPIRVISENLFRCR